MFRSLFYIANDSISGANRIVFEVMRRLESCGQQAFAYCERSSADRQHRPSDISFIDANSFAEAMHDGYDFVFVAKAFLLPLALPHAGDSHPVLLLQDYEEDFSHSSLLPLFSLPISIMATSVALQTAVKTFFDKDSSLLPLAIDTELFKQSTVRTQARRCKRILMVGDYLVPFKGMSDGFAAVQKLATELDVQLVLITQQEKGRQLFTTFDFDTEIHFRPPVEKVPEIYASCDVYCCTSWFEGFGLPSLESFACGVPVVSTRNHGVTDYGIDGHNLLLADVRNSDQLCDKLRLVLTDHVLADKLVKNGFDAMGKYNWNNTMQAFLLHQEQIIHNNTGTRHRVSEADMKMLLNELEARGLYTPSVVRSDCNELFDSLQSACRELVTEKVDVGDAVRELERIREGLKPHLANSASEYYTSVKKKYDLCQLMIGLTDDRRALSQAARLLVGAAP